MADQPTVQITLSAEELKMLIQQAVKDALLEVLGEDLDAEPSFAPEIAERLRRYRLEKPTGIPVDEVIRELELDA